MSDAPRIYLDNAATSFPKPESVASAVDDYNRHSGAAVGRGAYRAAIDVQSAVDRCRLQAARLFCVEEASRIVFTFNGTDSLNLALHGILNAGDHVVTSRIEHNSVLRPLRELRNQIGIDVSSVPADDCGRVEPAAIRAAINSRTKLIALIHASNVTGTIQPIADVGEIARDAGLLFLVDAAQTAGHLPIDVTSFPVDLLACPGHKGLLGPLGTGLLYVRPGVEERLHSLRQGGTGSDSEDDRQPESLPDKYESGNHNAPGLIGLEKALSFLHQRGLETIRRHETELSERLRDGLRSLPALQVFGPDAAAERVGVVSVAHDVLEPQILAALLDENFNIQTRAGLHCAPGVHQAIGTFDRQGTVRFSVGPFSTVQEIDTTIEAMRQLLSVF